MTEFSIDLSNHRISMARYQLKQAKLLLNHREFDGSINRSYYPIESLLALVALNSRRHSGIISYFDKYFVKPGYFEKEMGRAAYTAFDLHQTSDYEDFQAARIV